MNNQLMITLINLRKFIDRSKGKSGKLICQPIGPLQCQTISCYNCPIGTCDKYADDILRIFRSD